MATKKDLVEAYSFSRRRLVTAFVSGAPGGREVEPSRPGRTIVGGIALAVLMIAGAAVLGILTDRDPGDWDKQGLVSAKGTSADYVILAEGEPLHQVINTTSALLLLGPDLETTEVSPELIAEADRGETLGILQAPVTPPDANKLLQTGWTACTGRDFDEDPLGVKVTVTSRPDDIEARPRDGLVVRSGGKLYLLAEALVEGDRDAPRAYYHQIDEAVADPVLQEVVDTNRENAVDVPQEWLDLFTPGAPLSLESLGLSPGRIGKPPRERPEGVDGDVLVGQLLQAGDSTYLVNDTSKVTELDEFALAVYQALPVRGVDREPRELDTFPSAIQDTADLGINWPTRELEEKTSGQYCAQLDTVPGGIPGSRIVSTTTDDGEASAALVPPGGIDRFVESGSGAVVRIGDWDREGDSTPVLLDDRGMMFPLVGEAQFRLGYGDVEDVIVPDSWAELFQPGVELSVDAARCPPTTTKRESPCVAS